jgi:inorganic pyrophosphatase/exopolyphosphatase
MLLRDFLRVAKAGWTAAPALEVVIGNEAADADSCVSALVYGLLLHAQRPAAAAPRVLPVISCARADFALRREAVVMLERCLAAEAAAAAGSGGGADAGGAAAMAARSVADDLVFVDELEAQLPRLRSLAASRSLGLTLVDHNQLTGGLAAGGLGGCVVRIVDHHVDAGDHAHVAGPARNISFDVVARKGVGSTCTLVAEALAQHDADAAAAAAAAAAATAAPAAEPAMLPPPPPRPLLSAPIAELLLGVILLDTSCLSSHAGKTTPRDTAAVALLARAMSTATGGSLIDADGLE